MFLDRNPILLLRNKSDRAINYICKLSFPLNYSSTAIAFTILSVATVALAFSPIFTRLSEAEISPSATIFNRLWIATIVLGCWQEANGLPQNEAKSRSPSVSIYSYQHQGLLLLASIAATTSALCWAWSLTQTSVASSTVIRSLTPLFVSFGGWLLLKQRFDRQFVLGMLLAIAGGVTIGWDDWQLGTENLLGDEVALLSAALHGLNLLIVGYLRDELKTSTILLWRCAIGSAILFPLAWISQKSIFPVSVFGWLMVIALAIVCQTFGQGLLVYSLKQFSSSFVSVFVLLKPVVTALLAWVIFDESLSLINAMAFVVVLGGIYVAKSSSSAVTS